MSALAYEPGYEDFCDLMGRGVGDVEDNDDADMESDWASRLSSVDGTAANGEKDMECGFENEATTIRGDETGVYPAEAVGAEWQPEGVDPGFSAVLQKDSREQVRIDEAIDGLSFLHPESVAKVIGDVLGQLPMERRATILANALCDLDYEHIGRIARESLLMLKQAHQVHAEKLKKLKALSLEAECAYHYATDGLIGAAE